MESENSKHEYLVFILAGEKYCIGVDRVREVVEFSRVTKLPNTRAYMKGLINLRGAGVPVVDLRIKFGMPEAESTRDTSIIVLEILEGSETKLIGAIADSVQEVIDLAAGEIEAAPRFGTAISNQFIQGIGKLGSDFLIMLDVDRIFSAEEAAAVAAQ